MKIMKDIQYRKVYGLVGEQSLSIVLPKSYALHLGLGKGDFVKVHEEENRIIVEKAEN
jgi:antitoxin component of MazEF toxin-antitoxin module